MEPTLKVQEQYLFTVYDAEDREILDHSALIQRINANLFWRTFYTKSVEKYTAWGLHKITIKLASSVLKKSSLQSTLETVDFESKTPEIQHLFFRIVLQRQNFSGKKEPLNKDKLLRSLEKLSMLLIGMLQTTALPSIVKEAPVVGCRNMFYSGAYRSYLVQLKAFVEGLGQKYPLIYNPDRSPKMLFQHRAISLARHILDIDLEKPEEFYDAHKKTLNFLRLILRHKNDNDTHPIQAQIKDFVDDLTEWMYTQPKLEKESWELLVGYMPSLRHLSLQKWLDLVPDITNHLSEHPKLSGCVIDFVSDMHLTGNVPIVLWTLKHPVESSETRFIRSPNVILQNDYGPFIVGYNVIDDFKNFVRRANEQGKAVFYVNLMGTKNNYARGQAEGILSDVLHNLEKDPTMSNLSVCSMDRNSDFYFASKQYSDSIHGKPQGLSDWQTPGKFKEELLNHLFDERGQMPCIWPAKIDKPIWKARCKSIIDTVHSHHFRNADVLDDESRGIFNEIVLAYLLDDLVKKHRPHYCVIGCQSSVDRGPSFYSLLRLLQLRYTIPSIDESQIKDILGMLFANAILTQNRPPYTYRVIMFYRAAELLLSGPPMCLPE